tara:strand:+ start:194 stop:370 length:177 start_codon:yes stop_codon:yes gene_type:complete
MEILNNEAFAQTLSSELNLDLEQKRRRRTVRRVSARRPKGQRVYSKSGKARMGRWIRV